MKEPILYHYYHCPFCVRVRMALGYLNILYKSKHLAYNDEKTPLQLCGKKMLPIWQDENKSLNESLDIIAYLDSENKTSIQDYLKSETEEKEINELLNELGSDVHSLAMPYWIYTKEFDVVSRKYFQIKKEEKRGPFKDLIVKRSEFEKSLNKKLQELEKFITKFYRSDVFTIKDILIASHLWGMYIVPEFQFSPTMHDYLQRVKVITKFKYLDDLWLLP